jgi:hypothetical protein
MKRRKFITLLGGAVAAGPLMARAQEGERPCRIGVLMNISETDPSAQVFTAAVRNRLREQGFADGRNARIDLRWAAGAVEGYRRWALNPANRSELTSLLMQRLKQPQDIIEESLKASVDEKGYAPDAQLDMKGFENTLKLRAEMLGTWGGSPPPASKYSTSPITRRRSPASDDKIDTRR